jgi:hypothetical protein
MTQRVLVVGGSGYFGSLLVEELLLRTKAEIAVGGRHFDGPPGPRLTRRFVDLREPASVEAGLEGITVAVCAAGPFQDLPTTLLKHCLERGIPYVDLADDRDFVRRARGVVEAKGPRAAAAPGWSAVPALSALLARLAADELETVETIRIQIAPGNRAPRGRATVASLLHSAGRPFTVWDGGGWRTVTGWSEPETFSFGPPIGPRAGYLVDVPDHELLPPLFGGARVEFRAGSELPLLNGAMSFLAGLARSGWIADWEPWIPALRTAMSAFGRLGDDSGALGVEVEGGGRRRRATIIASSRGQRIAALSAALLVERLLDGRARWTGLVPLDRWLTREELESACAARGLELTIEDADD